MLHHLDSVGCSDSEQFCESITQIECALIHSACQQGRATAMPVGIRLSCVCLQERPGMLETYKYTCRQTLMHVNYKFKEKKKS